MWIKNILSLCNKFSNTYVFDCSEYSYMDNTVQQKKKNLFSILQYSLNDSYRIIHFKHKSRNWIVLSFPIFKKYMIFDKNIKNIIKLKTSN